MNTRLARWSAVRETALRYRLFRGDGPAHLDALYDLIIPVDADLEEEPLLGFTLGRAPGAPLSLEHPAFVTLNIGATRAQRRLGYAYLAAHLLVDHTGCAAPLPPATAAEVAALSPAERDAWSLALALLTPPGLIGGPDAPPPALLAETIGIPAALLACYPD